MTEIHRKKIRKKVHRVDNKVRKKNRSKTKRKVEQQRTHTVLRELKYIFISFFSMTIIVMFFVLLTTSFGRMDGYSMLPTVAHKDVFTVDKKTSLKRFDLVYIKVPSKKNATSVRRIIGMPGDAVMLKNDVLYVNHEEKAENYLNTRKNQLAGGLLTEDFSLLSLTGQSQVPEGSYFLLGDNRQSSADSRDYGFVKSGQIIGKVETKIFPLDNLKRYR